MNLFNILAKGYQFLSKLRTFLLKLSTNSCVNSRLNQIQREGYLHNFKSNSKLIQYQLSVFQIFLIAFAANLQNANYNENLCQKLCKISISGSVSWCFNFNINFCTYLWRWQAFPFLGVLILVYSYTVWYQQESVYYTDMFCSWLLNTWHSFCCKKIWNWNRNVNHC